MPKKNTRKTNKIALYNPYVLRARHIYSQILFWGKAGHSKRRTFNRLLSESVKRILKDHLQDNMKAPLNNAASSALFAPSSFNIYFGDNLKEIGQGQVIRAAYATHCGASSIGLDPRHATLNWIDPTMSELRDIVREKVQHHYRSSKLNCDFNHVSVKVYYRGKITKEHTDMEFNRSHTAPKDGNSQVPNTPVAMVCLGDPKYIEFVEYFGGGKGTRVSPNKSVLYKQNSRTMVILDPRDEELNERGTFWKHKSEQFNKHTGVTISFMFRVVQAESHVHSDTGYLVNPVVRGTGKKRKQFDKGWEKVSKDPTYSGECKKLMKEIRTKLAKYLV